MVDATDRTVFDFDGGSWQGSGEEFMLASDEELARKKEAISSSDGKNIATSLRAGLFKWSDCRMGLQAGLHFGSEARIISTFRC